MVAQVVLALTVSACWAQSLPRFSAATAAKRERIRSRRVDLVRIPQVDASPRAVAHDVGSTEWQTVRLVTNALTGVVTARTGRVVELASGLNYRDAEGRWRPSRAEFTRAPGGYVAERGPHRVVLPDVMRAEGVVLTAQDGLQLRCAPLCLGYYDPVTGRSVTLAIAQLAPAEQIAPNQIAYAGLFQNPDATVRYTYERYGFSQEVVFHQAPPPPELFGLSARARLEVITEFGPETATPQKTEHVLRSETNLLSRATLAELDWTDETLRFGNSFVMRPGKAFAWPAVGDALDAAPVAKRFEVIGDRPVLIEAVEHLQVRALLNALPACQPSIGWQAANHQPRQTGASRALPTAYQTTPLAESTLLAGFRLDRDGLVLDWQAILPGSTLSVLQGDTTYLVSGNVYLSGVTIEGGAVVKFVQSPPPTLSFQGLTCRTTFYHPAFFTALTDNMVGEIIDPSPYQIDPGNPYFADTALDLWVYNTDVQHLRISNARQAIRFNSMGSLNSYYGNRLRHVQILRCQDAVRVDGNSSYPNSLTIGNALLTEVSRTAFVLHMQGANATAEHVTVDQCVNLVGSYVYSGVNWATLKNSVLASVAHAIDPAGSALSLAGYFNGFYESPQFGTEIRSTAVSPFLAPETGEEAAHYLADGTTFRDAGTTSIDATLLGELGRVGRC
jgi:hypothetical protein